MKHRYLITETYQRLCQINTLERAFRSVKRNKGCGGIDRVSLKKFEQHLDKHLAELSRLLQIQTYQPLPLKRVFIPKPNGKQRPLGIPAIRDRVVQQALLEILEPIFEPTFANSSYGFRPRKSAISAVEKVQEYLDCGHEYIVEADIKDFFTTLHHTRLMSKIKEHLPKEEKQIIQLLWRFLKAGVMEEGKLRTATAGTPQGGVISPLLANVYLNDFDHKIEKSGLILVRYADDFVVLCQTVNHAVRGMRMVREIMTSMDLELALEKTGVRQYWRGFDFLGYTFRKTHGNKRWPRSKAIKVFKDKVRHVTRRQQPKNVKMVIERLNPVIRGWGHYFKHGNVKSRFSRLDAWTRMRLRSFVEKKKWPSGLNWKYPNDHFQSLGLVTLTDIRVYQLELSLLYHEQPCRRAVCGKSARTVR